jgi:peroxiredoxin
LKAQMRSGLSATVLLGLILAACSYSPERKAAAAVKSPKDRNAAPEFALKDVNGTTVRLSDYRGKVVLLNFWATWCAPCTIEIPWFMEFEQKNKDRGFAVVGIAMDEEGWTVVKPFLAEMRVNYRTLKGDDLITQLYGGVDSLPTTFMIDRQGKIASVHMGLISKSIYQNEIQELLTDPPERAGLLPGPGPGWAVVGAK